MATPATTTPTYAEILIAATIGLGGGTVWRSVIWK